MNATKADATEEPQPAKLSPGVQSTISLLLVIHLFAISACFFSVLPSSELQARLLTVLSPYVQLLRFDLDFRPYYLTRETLNNETFNFYGEREYLMEVLPAGADAEEEASWIRLDAPYRGWLSARHRFLRYADAVNFNADSDETIAIFARDVGRHWVATRDETPVLIRIRQHRPVPRQRYFPRNFDDPPVEIDANASRYYRTVYTARFLIGGDGEVSILKEVSQAETANSDTSNQQQPANSADNP